MQMYYAVSIRSIFFATKVVKETTNVIFQFHSEYFEKQYERIYKLTYSRTMVASGETRTKLFKRISKSGSRYNRYVCGYAPTSNNQSVHQEFDTNDPVHRSKKEHFRADGRAKCSRRPVDLYASFGGYSSNRSARRRSLAVSIEDVFGTDVSYATDRGSNLQYEPDLSNVIRKLNALARGIARG